MAGVEASRDTHLLPVLRADLERLDQAAPGKPDRFLLKDPQRGSVLEMTSRERFICDRLDGRTTEVELRDAFRVHFGMELSVSGLRSLLVLLQTEGLLADRASVVPPREWETMRPLAIDADRLFSRIAAVFGPLAGWPGVALFAILLLLAFGVLLDHWSQVWSVLSDFLWHIEVAGHTGFSSVFSIQTILQVAVFFTVIPFFRELAKGAVCTHHGARVPEIRFGWFMRFIPRCIAGIYAMHRLEKRQQVQVLTAGLLVELFMFCVGMIGVGVLRLDNPMHTTSMCLAIGAALRLLFTANPLGEQDGAALLGLWMDEPDFRFRSVRAFRAWLLGRPMPEPLGESRRRKFIRWGAASDLVVQALTIAMLWLFGYVLIQWMGGLGAVLLMVLIVLKYEKEIRSLLMDHRLETVMPKSVATKKSSVWFKLLIAVVIIALLWLIPYPFEVSGEFRVQPVAQREVRSEISALIQEITVDEGDLVKAGDVIARLDARTIQKDLDLNRSALRKEQEHLRAMETGARPEDIAQLEQAVKAAETKLKYSEDSLKRTEDLHKKTHVSDQDYQNVLMVRDLDIEGLELARLSLAALKAGVRAEEIEAQREVIKSLEIGTRHLESELERTTITSPIDGRVVTMFMQGRVGSQSAPGDVIAVVEDLSQALIRIALPESYVGLIQTGATVRIRPWAHSGSIFKGEVTAIMPMVLQKSDDIMKQASMEQEHGMVRNLSTPEDRIVPVLAVVQNDGELFKSDMTGYAKISAGWKPIGYAFFHPIIRFFKVQVWSWIP